MRSSSREHCRRHVHYPDRVNNSRFFMDHAATSPLRATAKEALMHTWDLGNPGGTYASGRQAKRVLEESREHIAELLGADPIEVIFTGSGTEADNIAIHGLWNLRATATRRRIRLGSVEHPAAREPVAALAGYSSADVLPEDGTFTQTSSEDGIAGEGSAALLGTDIPGAEEPTAYGNTSPASNVQLSAPATVLTIPVDRHGHYDLVGHFGTHPLDGELDALVVAQWANNESGAIHDVEHLAAACAQAEVPWHADAVQAVGHIPVNFHASGAATLAASAHKFGGPRSTGLLLVKREYPLVPWVRGGGQERGWRSGTVNVAGAAATAAALAEAVHEIEAEAARVAALRNELRDVIAREFPDAQIHTAEPALPGHLHVSFPGCEGDSLIMLLDAMGCECSTGSACATGVNRVSHVTLAMGVDPVVARGTVRFTLGAATTPDHVAALAGELSRIVAAARAAGMA